MTDFTHLHCHTDYSLLESLLTVENLCKGTTDKGMQSVAITDRGTLASVPTFIEAAQQQGIKPIIGCEISVLGRSCQPDITQPAFHHLVLLAMDSEGYHNLKKILTMSDKAAPVHGIVTTKSILAKYHKGIIALSGATRGEIDRTLAAHGMSAASDVSKVYSQIFDGRFYLEIQPQTLDDKFTIHEDILELAKTVSLPLVATNNVHYLTPNQSDAHDLLMCLRDKTTLGEKHRTRYTADRSLLPPQEMIDFFKKCPMAIESSAIIADQCVTYADIEFTDHCNRHSRFRERSAFFAIARALGLSSTHAQSLFHKTSRLNERDKDHLMKPTMKGNCPDWTDDEQLLRIILCRSNHIQGIMTA